MHHEFKVNDDTMKRKKKTNKNKRFPFFFVSIFRIHRIASFEIKIPLFYYNSGILTTNKKIQPKKSILKLF